MSPSSSIRMSPPEVSLLVCESGRRWCDTARRFIGPFQHAPQLSDDRREARSREAVFVVQSIEHSRVRAMIAGRESVAIVWEISRETASSIALTIAQIGVGRPDVVQLITVCAESAAETRDLSLRILELGIAAVVQTPEQFPMVARLLRRRFARRAVEEGAIVVRNGGGLD